MKGQAGLPESAVVVESVSVCEANLCVSPRAYTVFVLVHCVLCLFSCAYGAHYRTGKEERCILYMPAASRLCKQIGERGTGNHAVTISTHPQIAEHVLVNSLSRIVKRTTDSLVQSSQANCACAHTPGDPCSLCA